jgi:antitoxin (DNA-binding transcriptional repressor) of toxin-antitoxin stability system
MTCRNAENRYFGSVIVTATELANDANGVLNRVIQGGETIQIQRQGKTVAQITPAVGVSRDELLRALRKIRWTAAESRELKQAMDAASEVFGYAGRD